MQHIYSKRRDFNSSNNAENPSAKRILITGGGTTMPIDPVRRITNNSTGRFAASLATVALEQGHLVTYLRAADAASPFAKSFDCYAKSNPAQNQAGLARLQAFADRYRSFYQEKIFSTFDDYTALIQQLIQGVPPPDVVILAAAVSDYRPMTYSATKIRSDQTIPIQLQPTPKIIARIKQALPKAFVVGFKLLVGASDDLLVETARQNIRDHGLDMVVANDLETLQRNQHAILVVTPDGVVKKYTAQLGVSLMNEIRSCITK